MASRGYTFAESTDVQVSYSTFYTLVVLKQRSKSTSAVLANTMSLQLHPIGFRILNRPVAASSAHPYPFCAPAKLATRLNAAAGQCYTSSKLAYAMSL